MSFWLIAVFFAAIVGGVNAWRFFAYQYQTFDAAFYVQGLWLALRGGWNVSLLDVPIMGNHAEPIVFLFLPIFALVPHALVLVAGQTLALASMAWSGWRIAQRQGIEGRAATWLAAALLAAPATGFAGLHEFHPETLAGAFLLLAWEARLAERLGRYWLWLGLAAACKENIAAIVAVWAAVHWWKDRARGAAWNRRWHGVPLLLAVAWVGGYATVLGPLWNGGKVDYFELYSHLGKSGREIVGGFFSEPGKVLGHVWRAATTGDLVGGTFAPLLLLPLLRPRWLLIAAPLFAQHLLSWRESEWSLRFHYGAPILVLAWLAAAEAIARWPRRAGALSLGVLVACMGWQVWRGPLAEILAESAHWPRWESRRALYAPMVGEAVQSDRSITAAANFLAHVAPRREVRTLHHVLKGLRTLSRAEYTPPPPTELVLCDFLDTSTFDVGANFYHPQMRMADGRIVPNSDQLLADYLAGASWRTRRLNSLSYFEQTGPPSAPVMDRAATQKLFSGLDLIAAEVQCIEPGRRWKLRVATNVTTPREAYFWLGARVAQKDLAEDFVFGLPAAGVQKGMAMEEFEIVAREPFQPAPALVTLAVIFSHHCLTEPESAQKLLHKVVLGHSPPLKKD